MFRMFFVATLPVVDFVALGTNLVRPVCDRCETCITDQ